MSKHTNRRASPSAFILAAISGFTLAATAVSAETGSYYGFSAPKAPAQQGYAPPQKGPQGQAYHGGPLAQNHAPSHSVATSAGYPAYAQGYPAHGFPAQGYQTQGYQTQGYPAQGYQTQSYPAPYGGAAAYGAPVPGYGPGVPASVYGQPPQGYGYPVPGVAGIPAVDPYGSYPNFGSSLFAPAEPIYAPAERFGGSSAATAPAEPATAAAERVTTAPAPKGDYVEIAPSQAYTSAPAVSSGYSVEAPATESATYVGPSQQIAPASSYETTDPYSVILQQQPAAPQQPVYEPYKPVYEQYEQAAPQPVQQQYQSYEQAAPAPAPQPVQQYQSYEQAAPAPQPVPQYQSYEQTVIAPAPVQQAAPAYEFGAVAAPSPAAPTYSSVPAGSHFVQVGAFRDPNRAERLVSMLAAAGEPAFIVPAIVRGKQFYRVRVAAGDSKRDATYIRDRIRNLGHYEARIVKG